MLVLLQFPFPEFPLWLLLAGMTAGFVALYYGGGWMAEGAAAISVNLNLNPVIIGLTVVAVATSMPEMVTSLLAAAESPGIAVGNILGSNLANVGLILGVAALMAPLTIQLRLIRRETPILLLVTVIFSLFALGGGFTRAEGLILLGLLVVYLLYLVRWALGESREVTREFTAELEHVERTSGAAVFLILAGAGLLTLGADILVGSAAEFAGRLGVSAALIGLSIVAIGTSLPELAASVAAARAGYGDICAGNLVGSNLFNLLLVGGGVAALHPIAVDPGLFRLEFPALLVFTLILLLFFKTGRLVSRKEGVCLLLLYVIFLIWAFLGPSETLPPSAI